MVKLYDKFVIDLTKLIPPILYIIIGVISYEIIKRIINNIMSQKKILKKRRHQKRAETLHTIILNVIKYLIVIFVLLGILSSFGVNVKSIIAGLGVTAALAGLALQDIAKDFLAGISIVTEDQYEIGDTVEINGFLGEVVFLGLKTTKIRNYKGATKIIANHLVTEVINYNLHDSLALVDVSVSYDHDPDEVEKVLEELKEELIDEIPNSKGPLQIWGINELGNSSIVYRLAMETVPTEHWGVERQLRKKVKEKFDAAGIKIPYPQIEVHNHGKK